MSHASYTQVTAAVAARADDDDDKDWFILCKMSDIYVRYLLFQITETYMANTDSCDYLFGRICPTRVIYTFHAIYCRASSLVLFQ